MREQTALAPVQNLVVEDETGMSIARQGFDIEAMDRELGGGLLPGTLTVVAGATGTGKTQLGLRWAEAGLRTEGSRGLICDLTSRGDSQNHIVYARNQLGWELQPYPFTPSPSFEHAWDESRPLGAYFILSSAPAGA